MKITIALFGKFREFQAESTLTLDCVDVKTIADVRSAFDHYASQHWPNYRSGLLEISAFASDTQLLHNSSAIPDDHRLAILPPVSGG